MTGEERRVAERFWAKVKPSPGDCWTWTACVDRGGYGLFRFKGKSRKAHRVSFELHHGHPVPEGLELDHLCRVRSCVNPNHLDPVTHAENVTRGRGGWNMAVKTHCPQGHPYEGENLWNKGKCRVCRTCHRTAAKERMRRLRANAKESDRTA